MKENAELAFAERRGGDLLLDALQSLAGSWGDAASSCTWSATRPARSRSATC